MTENIVAPNHDDFGSRVAKSNQSHIDRHVQTWIAATPTVAHWQAKLKAKSKGTAISYGSYIYKYWTDFFIYAVFPFLLFLLMVASHQPLETYIIPLMEVYYLLTLVGGFLLTFAWIAKLAINRP